MAKKTSAKINKTIKDYIDVIRQDMPVSKVVLFGSHAKGKAKQGSDIDIAIVSDKFGKNPRKEGQYLFRKLWKVKNSAIDPVGYSPKDFNSSNPSPLLHEIRKHGKEVKV
ncbi:TPA: nucleotidyltransferase [Patescibacteria group bacterium]|nr:MAG: hypothetical protein UT71_C0004G0030 [Parcubacteria group bacterium GW2011_GWF2_40_10]KKR47211.1 MAG: hypothetical protein UT83_C0012G0012 [Parcubacteria group bacterium GW2011_GWA2_40_143]KKR60176.1 MAG: hypothetical protein UT97_C0004G0045 [Parcubacteria group bacterium GW2011_GWC2_40_31]KKR74333.1 MAG: hypothetical protein UU18_C0030G0007 [Parcubacteria group bacterium GW2011_GWB2_40_8]KKR83390.1 MAG: hypothetical protein UU28_C0001G0010 [Parcubacteria group bacterium GW2011_GWD2_40_